MHPLMYLEVVLIQSFSVVHTTVTFVPYICSKLHTVFWLENL
jgi:hypothetical protein